MSKYIPLFLLLGLPSAALPGQSAAVPADIHALLEKNGCNACHKLDKKLIGPSWIEIAARRYPKKRLTDLVYKPEPANWPGYVPMQPMPLVPRGELNKISAWIVALGTSR